MSMDEQRGCWRLQHKNGAMAITSGMSRRAVHSLVPPNSIVLDLLEHRTRVITVSTKHAAWYEPFLLEDAFYWMDLSLHPQIVQHPQKANLYTDLDITTGLTVWGKVAHYWVRRGYCYDAFAQRKCGRLTEEYYESWWSTRADGIPKHVFHALACTDHHHLQALKRDMTLYKITANEGPVRYTP
jgi:hypothetical protein